MSDRSQMSEDRGQISEGRLVQSIQRLSCYPLRLEVGIRKSEFGKAPSGMNPAMPSLSSVLCRLSSVPHLPSVIRLLSSLLVLILATSCNPDRPNFEPSYSGAPPEEDLNQYLDTKAVFVGLDKVKGKRQQVDSLLTLADKLKNYDDDVALVYADTAYSMALEKNWELSRGIASYYIALLKGRREKYGEGIEDALVDARISKELFMEVVNQEWSIRINNLIGIFYHIGGKPDSTRYYLEAAQKILNYHGSESEELAILKGELLHDFANFYFGLDSIDIAGKFFQESLDLYRKTENFAAQARLNYDWAQMLYNQKEFPKAQVLIQSGLEYALSNKDKRAIIMGYQKMGNLRLLQYNSIGQGRYFDEAIEFYDKCLQLQRQNLYYVHIKKGNCYQQRAFNSDDEMEVYRYVDSSIISYRIAMQEARKEGALPIMKKMGRNISRLCSWRTRVLEKDCIDLLEMNSADFLNLNYAGLTDTIGQVLMMANQRNRANERREIEVENRQQRRIQWIISGASLLFAGLIFILVFQVQQQKRLKAKMEALRAQINPHFISNSLNAIESLVNLDRKDAATKYLVHFSRLTRKVLNSSRDGKVSLAEEIKTLEHFLELEQLRFSDKLRYLIDVDEDIHPSLVEMPAMILQPYIENAIWHGIKPKEGPGLVKVQVEKEGKHLVCIIKDDGIGRTKAAEIKAASVLQQNSVGMKINQERLNVVGRAKGAKVEIIDLHDEDGNASGTKVIIRLPYKEITKT